MSSYSKSGCQGRRLGAGGMAVLLASLLAGCSEQSGPASPPAPGPARYGEPVAQPASAIPRVRPFDPRSRAWQDATFAIIETDLSPATLIRSASSNLTLFAGMPDSGLGAPTHVALSTRNGPRSLTVDQPIDPAGIEENWILVWFHGAPGWTRWDSPWAVFLQHRPVALRLDPNGLHFTFQERAGDVVLMPLYGYEKLPLQGANFRARYGRSGKPLETWKWIEGLRTPQLMRLRYWASATREFPVYGQDSFSVDRARDALTLRQQFVYHSIPDDWNTRPLKVAPVSPPLALAAQDERFPAQFNGPLMDYDYFTPYGPYAGIEAVDAYDVTFPILHYLRETERTGPPATNAHPFVHTAWQVLRAAGRNQFVGTALTLPEPRGSDNLLQIATDTWWYAQALPHFDAETRTAAGQVLRRIVHERLLPRRNSPDARPGVPTRTDPATASPEPTTEAAIANGSILQALWAYAHHTDDWDLIRSHWEEIRALSSPLTRVHWQAFGREEIVALGDHAGPFVALARLAYQAGDIDTYHHACYLFIHELVHHWLKLTGADYFHRHQPYHAMAPHAPAAVLWQLQRAPPGWELRELNAPTAGSGSAAANRWHRFLDPDVARFHRDYLARSARRELDWLMTAPSARELPLVRLRSLLLLEPPEALARVTAPDQLTGSPAEVIAGCLAYVRTAQPPEFDRLIPSGPPAPFVAGAERDVGTSIGSSVQVIDQAAGTWPRITWPAWQTPTASPWTFGHVQPAETVAPVTLHTVHLNWTTRVLVP